MPAKPVGDWRTAEVPRTLLQKHAFLDQCVAWLLESDDVPVTVPLPKTRWNGDATDASTDAPLSCTPAERRQHAHGACAVCKAPARGIIVNPYTLQCNVCICDACLLTRETTPV
jgi:hypothetical protein